ncbi:MAG: YibE/F family protein [Thermomicrobium sp.]|nr:YibE/F family protein [Thermomicrobium sp.]MDW8005372.1 YibE/F family protein [Thermomicrobium sp.]
MGVRAVLVTLVVTLVGLWLGQDGSVSAQQAVGQPQTFTATARVVEVLEEGVTTVGPVTQPYQRLLVELTSGPEKGQRVEVSVGVRDLNTAGQRFAPGDRLFLTVSTGPDGSRAYTILDRDRSTPLAVLAVLFAGAIVALGRWKGVRALLGLAFTFVVLIWVLVPLILRGYPPVPVAIAVSFVVFVVTLTVTHGVGRMVLAAMAGTSLSLILTGLLAALFVAAAGLTGLADEEASFLQVVLGERAVSPRGLLLAGMLVGALGVLDDITVSQSSLVFELRRANPSLTGWELFAAGVRVGRDHIAATVNTLVLAYAGAALPLLLLFSQLEEPLLWILNREIVAQEVVQTLVGSLGLIAAVPLTTGFAAWLAVRTPVTALEPSPHHHGHVH